MAVLAKAASGLILAAVLILGVLAQTASHLLSFTSPSAATQPVDGEQSPYSDMGNHPVGIRTLDTEAAPMPMTVWYPALDSQDRDSSLTYAYALNMLDADTAVSLASYPGKAEPGAAPDLSDGPYPLVVLSHGFAIAASSYGWLAEHLASHGMVVVAPHHHESLDPGALWRSTYERPRDIRTVLAFVEDAVAPRGDFEGLIESEKVAVIGHSYGGYTALASAGARLDTSGFDATCEVAYATDEPLVFLCDALQPRLVDIAVAAGLGSVPSGQWPTWSASGVDAVVSIAGDAAMFGESGLADITVPVLAIGGTADTDSPFKWGTRLSYDQVSSTRKVEVAFDDAAHLVFAGDCDATRRILSLVSLGFCSDPKWDRARVHAIAKHYVAAFLLAELAGDEAAMTSVSSSGPIPAGVSLRSEGY